MRSYSIVLALLLFSQSIVAATYSVDLPVKHGRLPPDVELNVTINQFNIIYVTAKSPQKVASGLVSDEVIKRIENIKKPVLDQVDLKELGITLILNKQSLTIELKISPESLKRQSLNSASSVPLPVTTKSAKWAVLNNFTLNAEKNSEIDEIAYQFNWEGRANVGGTEGWNFDWLIYADKIYDSRVNRGPITLFKEWYQLPLRVSFGDVISNTNGHGVSMPLGGVRIATDYRELQPTYRITPGNTQQFYLPQNAQVEVRINGDVVARNRLRVGNYDLNDLPLSNGVSEIEVIANYDNGEQQRFAFNSFFNTRLLRKGLFEYDLSAGYAVDASSIDYNYLDEPGITGMVNYGVYDWLTIGANGAYADENHTAGLSLTVGKWGHTLSLRSSVSAYSKESGSAFSVSSEHVVWGTTDAGSPNLFIGYDNYDSFLLSPFQTLDFLENRQRIYGSYTYFLTEEWDFTAYGEQYETFDREGHRYEAQLNWRYKDFRVALEFSDITDSFFGDQKGLFLNVSWADYDYKSKRRYRLDYRGRREEYRATLGRVNNNRVGQFGYEVEATENNRINSQTARSSYTSRVGRADIYAIRTAFDERDPQTFAGINLSNSIAIVDGHVGTGTSVVAPFALITSHSTLDDATVSVNKDDNQAPEAVADDLISGIVTLGSAYTPSEVLIDVMDAPLGYDWGPGGYRHVQGSRAAALITVGSDASYTVLGYFTDKDGKAIKLLQGTASNNEDNYTIFTNKTGRFVIEGARPGSYNISLGSYTGKLTVESPDSSLVQVGKIALELSQ